MKPPIYCSILTSFFLMGCQSYRIIQPDNIITPIEWTETELTTDIAIRHLTRTTHSSHHVVRLAGRETPHSHDKHDLIVTVLRGTSVIHFKDRSMKVKLGDTIAIPAGTYHWAENIGQDATEVMVVFSPAFDGEDKIELKEAN